ncbi:MAG: Hpt domain-containing protein, partial [Pyrinomonadaceae bacterium]
MRRNLLALEAHVGRPRVDPALLDELFRSFHTLKGISGMVGLGEAEQLAHYMEGYLRALRQGEAALGTEGVEALVAGTTTLERAIAARRTPDASPPGIDSAVARLEALTPGAHASAGRTLPEKAGTDFPPFAARAGVRTWRFEFVPTPALAERGVNVNAVRARLQEVGEVIKATPQVRAQGGIAFEFIAAGRADESTFESWRDDNLTYELIGEEPEPSPPTFSAGDAPSDGDGAPPPPATAAAPMLSPSNSVRVDLSRLDELMRMIGEMVVSRARLEERLKPLRERLPAVEWRALQETHSAMGRQLRDLREGVMRVRMVPIGEVFERMRFVVRDLARESGKKIRLELSGQETEVDKYLVERMMDPLLHLVRNAV